ncbi:MAG: phosphoglucosamine mutase [Planctomycetes bacterium]|nr:phosphoglucosamine mutase [Planctomycetota bacterium]
MNQVIPSDLIVSVSGIRGIVGEGLTPAIATSFAAAFGTWVGGGRVIVSRDSRPSGNMLRHAVIAGLLSSGCSVIDIGISPTPTCGITVRHLGAAGCIQISASHNPAPWNGLKMFGSDGAVLSAEKGAEVRGLFEAGERKIIPWNKIGDVSVPPDVLEYHAQMVCDQAGVAAIHASGFRVFIDANGGAGGPLALMLLNALGCEVIEYACIPDGHFVHEAEPIPAHLVDVGPLVERNGASIGFVLDPDADRLVLIDEKGNCVSEELTLALAVQYRLAQKPGNVVINMSTSRVVEDIAKASGSLCLRTAVGEANVVSGMRMHNAVIGGEGNGGVIDPRVGWIRDPFIGMALILHHMAESGKTLSELVAALPTYAMLKTKYTVAREKLVASFNALQQHWPDASINRLDGLRLDWKDRWVHVRASNTEPIVRVIAEAPTIEEAQKLCDEAGACLK